MGKFSLHIEKQGREVTRFREHETTRSLGTLNIPQPRNPETSQPRNPNLKFNFEQLITH